MCAQDRLAETIVVDVRKKSNLKLNGNEPHDTLSKHAGS
jgi:hypothetical protein